MSLWKQWKESMLNPPPERLAKVEYQSHFLNMAGMTIVSIILLLKGFWYIIFAYIFTIGVSWSQGMAALQRYKYLTLDDLVLDPIADIEKEISPMRRRRKTLVYMAGPKYSWLIMALAILISMNLLNPFGARWYVQVVFTLTILPVYLILYFGLAYSLIKPYYKRRLHDYNGRRAEETRQTQTNESRING